jgi:hypothetical protein
MSEHPNYNLEPRSLRVPAKVKPLFEAVVARTDASCAQRLNAEYADLCQRLTAALARKRPSPLGQGDPNTWACAILYAIGKVNFLFDKTQNPHLTPAELCSLFGVSQSTASAKAAKIITTLGMYELDPRWCPPSLVPENPLVWIIEVNGFLLDARDAPRHIQQEAFRRGLIPYLPQ